MSSELSMLIATARMGFNVVPIGMAHNDKGTGLLYMDDNGLRFVPDNGNEPMQMTWEQFDKGPKNNHSGDQ